jgi:hypothetical protein
MSITLSALQKQRRDTAANWTSANPTLLAGEIGIESDTGYWKVGDGSTAWNSLGYLGVIPSSGTYPLSQLIMPLGTAGAPPLTFVGDLNTGIYSPGADQVAISTNGTGRLFINSAGNAVIGSNTVQTFTGYTSLTLDNATNGGVLCINKNAVNIANISATNDALSIDAAGGGSSPIVFRTGAATTERLRITAAGLVGVGTSTPSDYESGKNNLVVANTGGNAGLTIATSATGYGEIAFADGTVGNQKYRGQISYDHTNDKLVFYSAATTAVTIDASQRVGIGVSSPGFPLSVSGNSGTDVAIVNGIGGAAYFGVAGNKPINFETNGSTKMSISAGGSVGIGTTAAGNILEARKDQDAGTKIIVQNQTNGASALTGVDFQSYGGGWQIEVPASASFVNPLRFAFNGSEKARLDSSGNFGIASSGNLSKLTVNSGNNLSSTALVAFNTQNANINGLTISNWTGSATTQGPRIAFDNSGNSGWIIGGANGNAGFDICQSWGIRLRMFLILTTLLLLLLLDSAKVAPCMDTLKPVVRK